MNNQPDETFDSPKARKPAKAVSRAERIEWLENRIAHLSSFSDGFGRELFLRLAQADLDFMQRYPGGQS